MITMQNVADTNAGVKASIGGHSVSVFAVKWLRSNSETKKRPSSRKAANARLFSNPKALLSAAEANTKRLTGLPRL